MANWTKEEIHILTQCYADSMPEQIREKLPMHSICEIRAKAHMLGIKKSDRIRTDIISRNLKNARAHITDDTQRKAADAHRETIRKEKLRARLLLTQKTKLRFNLNSEKVKSRITHIRYKLKKRGYLISQKSFVAEYNDNTKRTILEKKYEALGFTFTRQGTETDNEKVVTIHNEPFTNYYTS